MNENKDEEKEVYEIGDKKYVVVTRVIEDAKGINNLYEAFSRYTLRKLETII